MDYYSGMCRRSEEWQVARHPEDAPVIPEMSIESLDLAKAVAWIGNDDDEESWREFDEYHRAALKRLEMSGADFAVMASNTSHHRFAEIVGEIGIPVISILEAVASESVRIEARKVLILGTPLTMRSARFREAFAKCGVEAAGPADQAARNMTVDLIGELQRGEFEGAAERLGRIVRVSCADREPEPVVCLACTELPLAFPEKKMFASFEHDGISYINSTAAHIDAAFDFAVDKTQPRPRN